MISVCILTKNSARSIADTLSALTRFDEVILLDNGSTDRTIEMARSFPNVVIKNHPFIGFGPLRNLAATFAKHDWILAIDSDEILSKPLQEEILHLSLNPHCIYEINFCNYFNQKHILGCGWHPERHIRLYHRSMTRFSDSNLHEGILLNGLKVVRLHSPIFHTPYLSISDLLEKMQLYSDLFAKQNKNIRSSSFSKAFGHALAAFFKSYFLKRGFLMGKEGAIISIHNANVVFYKYLKLDEANRR